MQNISGSLYDNSEIDSPDKQRPVSVTSCGHYRLIKKEFFETIRPNGRRDYQLLYVANGKASFLLDGRMHTVEKGQMVVYSPYEYQRYSYRLCDNPDIYWLHFTGRDIPELFDRLKLSDKKLLETGTEAGCAYLFDTIILELQLKRIGYRELCNSYFIQMLVRASRCVSDGPSAHARTQQVGDAIQLFHTHFREPFCLQEYAEQCHISACWFARIFRREMGISPVQYLTDVRLNKAKELLASSSCTVGEIAEWVGYPNQLYFSRIFRKRVGVPPTEYRRMHKP